MHVWRLFRRRFLSTVFSGAGGMYVASRWNHLEVPMVYTATSRALAALEFFVNLEANEAPDDLLMAEAAVPDLFIEMLDLKQLPRNWRSLDNERCRDIGSGWARSLRSLALKVPSVVVDGDWNVLLNPRHPEFAKVAMGLVKAFRFDERLFR